MKELGLHPADGQVCFGQLLGMCDQISFPLGELDCPGRVRGGRAHNVVCGHSLLLLCMCRPGRLSCVQVCALRSCDGGTPLSVPPCPGEQQHHEGCSTRKAAAMAGAPQATAHWQPLPPPGLVTAGARPIRTPLNPLLLGLQTGHNLGLGWGSLAQPAQTQFTFLGPRL